MSHAHHIPDLFTAQCQAASVDPRDGKYLMCWLAREHDDAAHYDPDHRVHWRATVTVVPCAHEAVTP